MAFRSLLIISVYLFFYQPLAARDLEAFRFLYGGSQAAFDVATQQAQMAINGVLFASRLQGNQAMVTTGTLAQTTPDLSQMTYSPQPPDRLILKLFSGVIYEFQIKQLWGTFDGDAQNFLNRDHLLQVQGGSPGKAKLLIQSQQLDGQRVGHLKGNVVHEGTSYTLALADSGDYFFNSDSTGSEYRLTTHLTGTISAEQKDQLMQVNDLYKHHLVIARGNSGRWESASTVYYLKNSQLKAGSDIFRLDKVEVKKNFRNGKPKDGNYWSASGSLLQNQVAVGQIQLGTANGHSVEVLLNMNQGGTLVLERWPLN